MVDHVQCYAHFVKGFYADNLWRTWSYHTSSFAPSSCPLFLVGPVSYREDGVRSCRLHTIRLYRSGEVGTQVISSVIPSFHPHLRLSKPHEHHPSAFAPVLKTSLMCTPPSCGHHAQCPFQSIKPLLFRYCTFKIVQEFIHHCQPVI